MNKLTIGIIGLSTKRKALALNMADYQIKVAGYNWSSYCSQHTKVCEAPKE
ncbi:MAG: hypothetical protein RR624_02465 [Longicatena sp.]